MTLVINFFDLNLRSPEVNAKFGGMYNSFFRAFGEHGCRVVYSDDVPSAQADILVVPMGGGQEYRSIQAVRRFDGPVVLYVPPADAWFDERLLSQLRGKVLFVYSTDASHLSSQKYNQVGIPHYFLPFASDPGIMKPLQIPRQYDVVFVGSLNHAPRRSMFFETLLKSLRPQSILCIGSGWERYGIPEQLLAWGPALNVVYNLGRVCINIHTSSQVQGVDRQIDMNNRVFDLAMAGCCQICDNPEAVKLCFSDDEVVSVESPEEWTERVLFMLSHPAKAERYRQKALNRARQDHTWHQRAGEFLRIVKPLYENWSPDEVGKIRPHLGIIFGEIKRRAKNLLRKG